jgi:hypothetical protein
MGDWVGHACNIAVKLELQTSRRSTRCGENGDARVV